MKNPDFSGFFIFSSLMAYSQLREHGSRNKDTTR